MPRLGTISASPSRASCERPWTGATVACAAALPGSARSRAAAIATAARKSAASGVRRRKTDSRSARIGWSRSEASPASLQGSPAARKRFGYATDDGFDANRADEARKKPRAARGVAPVEVRGSGVAMEALDRAVQAAIALAVALLLDAVPQRLAVGLFVGRACFFRLPRRLAHVLAGLGRIHRLVLHAGLFRGGIVVRFRPMIGHGVMILRPAAFARARRRAVLGLVFLRVGLGLAIRRVALGLALYRVALALAVRALFFALHLVGLVLRWLRLIGLGHAFVRGHARRVALGLCGCGADERRGQRGDEQGRITVRCHRFSPRVSSFRSLLEAPERWTDYRTKRAQPLSARVRFECRSAADHRAGKPGRARPASRPKHVRVGVPACAGTTTQSTAPELMRAPL